MLIVIKLFDQQLSHVVNVSPVFYAAIMAILQSQKWHAEKVISLSFSLMFSSFKHLKQQSVTKHWFIKQQQWNKQSFHI